MRVIGMHAQCARWTSRRRFASGIMHSMDVAFDVRPGADVITVKATPAWITGMAYAVTGALSHRCTSIIAPCLDAAGLTRPAEAAATLLRQTRTSARLPLPPSTCRIFTAPVHVAQASSSPRRRF